MTIALGAAGLAISVVALLTWRSRRARQLHPQDVAFAVCTAFGPDLGLPREVRIRRIFPAIGDDTISAWLQDFERVDAELEKVARAGGPQLIGNKVVEDRLRRAFPFLVGKGLRQAVFLAGYSAMHDGYDKSPDPVRES
jgi:hypothetical protein